MFTRISLTRAIRSKPDNVNKPAQPGEKPICPVKLIFPLGPPPLKIPIYDDENHEFIKYKSF